MDELPAESIQRIADARPHAESELMKTLSGVAESDGVTPYLSAWQAFASTLFDSEAGEFFTVCEDAESFQAALEGDVAPRIVEGILPDTSLTRMTRRRTDEEKRLSIRHDMDTDLLWEVGPDGTRKPARSGVVGAYAQHGDWERFMPKGVRFLLRFPGNNATVRAALCQALQRQAVYWAGQFQIRTNAAGRSRGTGRKPSAWRAGSHTTATTSSVVGRKRGPKPDHEAAARVAEIVASMAPEGDWRVKLDEICEALDEAQVPSPPRWRKRDRSCRDWANYDQRANAVKAIEYRLGIAKQQKKATLETLS